MFRMFRRAVTSALTVSLLALSACGGGSDSSGGLTNTEPTAAVIRATALAVSSSSASIVQTPLGSTLTLDGSASTAQGGVAAYSWSLSTRPTGSTSLLNNGGSATATFVPDVAGTYQFTLQVTASSGSTASAVLPVTVTTAAPVVAVSTTVDFSAPVSNRPPQSVALGAVVTLNGAGSTDAAGGPVTLTFALLSAPASSSATLSASGTTALFSPDLSGAYQVRVRATAGSGLYADAVHTFNATATTPTVVVATSVTAMGTSSTLNAAVGNVVSLDGAGSVVPSGSVADGSWTLLSKPVGSGLSQLNGTSSTAISFVPDVPGTFTLQYTLVDRISGASSFHRVMVSVTLGPVAAVSANSAPVAAVNGPSFVGAAGSAITLRGGGSYDPAGGTLIYGWVLDTRPVGSSATLSNSSTVNASFTPDVDGHYGATLTVTTPTGLSAVQSLSLYVGKYAPIAVVDRSQIAVLLGNAVNATAANSYSQNNGALSYNWALDARPAGSNASIATPNAAALNFLPDLPGIYYASVTVSEGAVSSVTGVNILVLSASSGTVPLTYQPLLSRYSKSLGKAVIVSTTPNALHLVDPSAATDVTIVLPAAVKTLSLSANGQLAGVLHEGAVSLVDLSSATLIRTSATGGSHTEVFTANSGIVFLTGQTGGQWVTPAFVALDGRTGNAVGNGGGFASVYGVTRGVMSESLGRLYSLSEGLSPSQIYWTGVDPTTGNFNSSNGGSPYWGDYGMSNPLWLSADETLLFSASGNYFRTSTLGYVGNLGTAVFSVSHSASASELLALAGSSSNASPPATYPDVLKRYTGSLLFPEADVHLPLIAGQQTYGLAVFHTSDDKRVSVVQTGSNVSQASGLQYFVVLR